MKHYSRSPPGSPGKPQSTLLGGVRRRPTSPFSPVSRTDTAAPARESRGGEPLRAGEAALAVLADRRSGDVAPEEWVKVSWKKGECRGEIKLVAEAAGLGFEAAQIVALRLYNHFYWLTELRERSEKLFATIARERRFSLSLVPHPPTIAAAEDFPHDRAADDNECRQGSLQSRRRGQAAIAQAKTSAATSRVCALSATTAASIRRHRCCSGRTLKPQTTALSPVMRWPQYWRIMSCTPTLRTQ